MQWSRSALGRANIHASLAKVQHQLSLFEVYRSVGVPGKQVIHLFLGYVLNALNRGVICT